MPSQPLFFLLSLGDKVLPLSSRVPFFVQQKTLERSLNKVLAEPIADGLFDALENRWLCIHIRNLNLKWCVSKHANKNKLIVARHAPVEVSISGDWREFLLLASRQEDPDTLFFRRRLQIDGDTELGLEVKNLIDSLDSDTLPRWLWHSIERLGQAAAEQNLEHSQPYSA